MLKKAKNKKGRFVMKITEKATIWIGHWIKHNEDHLEEYGYSTKLLTWRSF